MPMRGCQEGAALMLRRVRRRKRPASARKHPEPLQPPLHAKLERVAQKTYILVA